MTDRRSQNGRGASRSASSNMATKRRTLRALLFSFACLSVASIFSLPDIAFAERIVIDREIRLRCEISERKIIHEDFGAFATSNESANQQLTIFITHPYRHKDRQLLTIDSDGAGYLQIPWTVLSDTKPCIFDNEGGQYSASLDENNIKVAYLSPKKKLQITVNRPSGKFDASYEERGKSHKTGYAARGACTPITWPNLPLLH